jgi:serine/threonine protein kinase
MLTKDLVVKLTNFGACKLVYTKTRKLMSYVGDYEYMAPEI